MLKTRKTLARTLAVAALVTLVSCTHDIDLSRLDTGPTDADVDVDVDGDGDINTDGDVEGETDADADADVEVDAETDGDSDADTDEDSEGDNDADFDVDSDEDSDTDADTDLDGDGDVETERPPLITEIDGDGSLRPVAGDTTEVPEPVPASHRFRSAWIVRGERLDRVTSARLEQTSGGAAVFTAAEGLGFAEGGTAMERRLLLPAALTVGAFTLTLTSPHGEAVAQTYVLQGEPGEDGEDGDDGAVGPAGPPGDSVLDCDGDTCTLAYNLVVEEDISGVNGTFTGDLDVAGAGTFDTLEVNDLTVLRSVWLPECPIGYERDDSREDIVLCTDGRDEMVKVGDVWVDRYEASVWADADCTTGVEPGVPYGSAAENYPGTFPDNGSFTAPLYTCSVSGVTPSRWLTWFQAQAACSASGKHLITNAEWQAAVEGTYDPGGSSVDRGVCLTSSDGPRPTGWAGRNPGGDDSCISTWGAEDMIGNLREWTSDWWQAGRRWMSSDGESVHSWPDGYSSDNDDTTWNLDGRAAGPGWENGLPAAGLRGGSWGGGTRAGAFSVGLAHAPSDWGYDIGFRCAR